jgi:hypothetical protein
LFEGLDGVERCYYHDKVHRNLMTEEFKERGRIGVKLDKDYEVDEFMFILCERLIKVFGKKNVADLFGISHKTFREALDGKKITHETFNKINVGIKRNVGPHCGVIPLSPSVRLPE